MSYWKELADKATIPHDHPWVGIAKGALAQTKPDVFKELSESGDIDNYAIAIAGEALLEYEASSSDGHDQQACLEIAMAMLSPSDDESDIEDWETAEGASEQAEQLMNFLGVRVTPTDDN